MKAKQSSFVAEVQSPSVDIKNTPFMGDTLAVRLNCRDSELQIVCVSEPSLEEWRSIRQYGNVSGNYLVEVWERWKQFGMKNTE